MPRTDIRLIQLAPKKMPTGETHPRVGSYSVAGQVFTLGSGSVPVIQAVISNLLTEAGSDKTDRLRGAGLVGVVRKYRMDIDVLKREVSARVRSVEQYMLEEQRVNELDIDESINALTLMDVRRGATPDELLIDITLDMADGTQFFLGL